MTQEEQLRYWLEKAQFQAEPPNNVLPFNMTLRFERGCHLAVCSAVLEWGFSVFLKIAEQPAIIIFHSKEIAHICDTVEIAKRFLMKLEAIKDREEAYAAAAPGPAVQS